jgi:hypothetical protein
MSLKLVRWAKHVAPILTFSTILSGCITTDHLYLGQQRYAARTDPTTIEFLGDAPTKPFVKIAMVEAVGRSSSTSWEEIRAALGEEAAKIGAHAVMELSMGSNIVGGVTGSRGKVTGGVGERRKLTGVAIRYKHYNNG